MATPELIAWLEDIVGAISEIETFVAGKTFDDYMAEPLLRRGVERDIEIISEASRHIPQSFKIRYATIPWPQVAGVGNILRHGYKLVDDQETWDIVSRDLVPLKSIIRSMMIEVEGESEA